MRKIIDANYFQSPDLTCYLNASKENLVVLCDIAGMETYKGNPVKNLERSYEILSFFPKQVLVLRGTRTIIKTAADAKTHSRWMVDKSQTAGFSLFYKQIKLAACGEVVFLRAVQKIAREAVEHFNRVESDVANMPVAYQGMASIYTDEEKRQLRAGLQNIDIELQHKLVREILRLGFLCLRDHVDVHDVPHRLNGASRKLPFRYAIANYLLFLRKLLNGDHKSVRVPQLANDIADMMYIAYATYFDGILSKEKMVNDVYSDVVTVLTWISHDRDFQVVEKT